MKAIAAIFMLGLALAAWAAVPLPPALPVTATVRHFPTVLSAKPAAVMKAAALASVMPVTTSYQLTWDPSAMAILIFSCTNLAVPNNWQLLTNLPVPWPTNCPIDTSAPQMFYRIALESGNRLYFWQDVTN